MLIVCYQAPGRASDTRYVLTIFSITELSFSKKKKRKQQEEEVGIKQKMSRRKIGKVGKLLAFAPLNF